MWLQYAVTDTGELVAVDHVPRGKIAARCPYCGGELLAKKGNIKVHHFAHAGETCAAVERTDVVSLPAYDNFNLHLSGKVLAALRHFVMGEDHADYDERLLVEHGLIQINEFRYSRPAELTKKGKLVVGQLSLMLFNDFQEPLIVQRHDALLKMAELAYAKPSIQAELSRMEKRLEELRSINIFSRTPEQNQEYNDLQTAYYEHPHRNPGDIPDFTTALTDLRIFRAQWRRILTSTLYFVEIVHSDGVLHKIGVTTRDIEARLPELHADLLPHLRDVHIRVLDTWPHRGNIELYFKHRYAAYQKKVGILTEYFAFDDAKAVLRDLHRMKQKQLSDLEQEIIDGVPAAIERLAAIEGIKAQRREAIRNGMAQAAQRGVHVGRPAEKEKATTFLAKPKAAAIRTALESGLSLRQAAAQAGVAVNTVRKVKALLYQEKDVGLPD